MVAALKNRLDVLLKGFRRPGLRFHVVDGSKLNQAAVGIPFGIAAESAALGIRRIAVNSGELERLRVDDGRMVVRAPDPDGLRRAHPIEIGPGGRALLRKEALVVTPAVDPAFARKRIGRLFEGRDEIVDRADVGRRAGDGGKRHRKPFRVRMHVEKCRHHECAPHVDRTDFVAVGTRLIRINKAAVLTRTVRE